MTRHTKNLGVCTLFCLALSSPAAAMPMADALASMLEQNERILAADANVIRSEYGIDQAFADFLPTIDLTASGGYERQIKPTPPNTVAFRNVEGIEVTQKIYDFGKTGANYEISKLRFYRDKTTSDIVRQTMMLDGIKAYLNVLRAKQGLDYAIQSESNIKTQTGMEQARVRRGSGLSGDVLQTKSFLAGAMATRVRAEGSYAIAQNRFIAVFGDEVPLDALEQPVLPYSKLPKTLNEAMDIAKSNSLTLKNARTDLMIARQQLRVAGANMAPAISGNAYYKHKSNDAGIMGTKEEMIAKLDVKYTVYAGGRDRAALSSAREAVAAAEWQLLDAEHSLEEKVSNAWQNFMTARANAQFLRNQSSISGEFLDRAHKERKLGKRSLMDVLNGETSYINTLSSAGAAETEMAVALFSLFESMGALKPDLFVMPSGAVRIGVESGTQSEEELASEVFGDEKLSDEGIEAIQEIEGTAATK
ncbi:MAG: TolC family protein [Pseudomonadota bacterium]